MVQTIQVRPGERFDLGNLVRFLARAGLPSEGLTVEQFPAGHSNLTYLLRSGDWQAVLRRPPLGPVAPRAHDMQREYRLLERLHTAFPLAPRPYLFCADESVIGSPFYLMERRDGVLLDRELPEDWKPDPAVHRAISESLVRTLVDLHAVDWQAVGLDEIGRPDGYLERQVRGWLDRYQRARTREVPEVEPLAAWFADRLPTSPPATMIHNDFKLNNVLLMPEDAGRLTAVLDWEMATVGDPLSDLATTLVYWSEPGDAELLGGLRSVTASPGFLRRREVVDLYARLSSRDLQAFDFYQAFAAFKVAVICQQIYFRWHRGQTHDPRFQDHERVAINLIRRAAETAGTRLD
jgi:aminoglycoside phosphotransferase (APT) family kinase protein